MRRFLAAWQMLCREGKCRRPGGEDYKVVLARWDAFGRPDDVLGFIRAHAQPPEPQEEE